MPVPGLTRGGGSYGVLWEAQHIDITVPPGVAGGLASINRVDLNYATLNYNGMRANSAFALDANNGLQNVGFFNNSVVYATAAQLGGYERGASVCVHRWNPAYVKSIVRSAVTIPAGLTNDVSSAFPQIVNANSILLDAGASMDSNNDDLFDYCGTIEFGTVVNCTQIRARRGGTTGNLTRFFNIVEFIPGVLDISQQYSIDIAAFGTGGSAIGLTNMSSALSINFFNGFAQLGSSNNPRGKPSLQYNGGTVAAAERNAITGHITRVRGHAAQFNPAFMLPRAGGGAADNILASLTFATGLTVNRPKTILSWTGEKVDDATAGAASAWGTLRSSSPTQLTSDRYAASGMVSPAYNICNLL